MEAFSNNFERFGGFLKTFLEKWRLLFKTVRLLCKLRGFLKKISKIWKFFLINLRLLKLTRLFEDILDGIEAFLK
jgi:hypothetical protein